MEYVNCRCPNCGHIRTQAANGSQVKQQCRQCGIYFMGVVRHNKFYLTGTVNVRPGNQILGKGPPTLTG